MARKGKHKQKKVKNYSKKKFRNVFCSVCALCDSKAQPDFCYPSIYKANPDLFVKAVYPNLTGASEHIMSCGIKPASIAMSRFSDIFCRTGACTNGTPMDAMACPSHDVCYPTFLEQVKTVESKAKIKAKNRKIKRQKGRQVYKPYPTFFTRKGDEFENTIRKILHEDNDNEQNKDQAVSGRDSGDADQQTEGRQS